MDISRYSRQMALPHIGHDGQDRLMRSRVVIIGCGALGTVAADLLVRAGVGTVRIIDRDVVELSNLQRQTLFTEVDVIERQPKAYAAARALKRVNSNVTVDGLVLDYRWDNACELVEDAAVVLDASDNYLTRLTVNDACLEQGIPWVYGGAVGYLGMTMNIIPGQPCFRCLMTELPPPGVGESCDIAGVLAPVTVTVAAAQVAETLKLIVAPEFARRDLLEIDLLKGVYRSLQLPVDPHCPACQGGQREFLLPHHHQEAAVVCGRTSVMLQRRDRQELDLAVLGQRLQAKGFTLDINRFRLQIMIQACEFILFADGRALINGTADPGIAMRIYNDVIGM